MKYVQTMEAINFQKDGKYKDLEDTYRSLVRDIRAGVTDKRLNTLYAGKIEVMLKKHFNMDIVLDLGENACGACVLPTYGNPRHILAHEHLKPYMDAGEDLGVEEWDTLRRKMLAGKKGTVNRKNATVGGAYAETETPIWISSRALVTQIGVGAIELLAITFHEVGHAFTYLETAAMTASVNQVLMDSARRIKEDKRAGKDELIHEMRGTHLGTLLDTETLDYLEANSDNDIIFSYELSRLIFESHVSIMKNAKYSNTASEQLADNFTVRLGYGVEIASGLSKLHKLYPEGDPSPLDVLLISSLKVLTSFLILMLGLGGLVPTLVLITISFLFISAMLVLTTGDDIRDVTYDEFYRRLKRIRQQMILKVKESNLSKKEKQLQLDDLDRLQDIMPTGPAAKGVYRLIANSLFLSNSRARDSIDMEQTIEDILANELIVTSLRGSLL